MVWDGNERTLCFLQFYFFIFLYNFLYYNISILSHSFSFKGKDVLQCGRQSAVLGQSLLEKSEQSSLVYIRWNQLHAALTEAHRKHSVFADSKKRALRVAKEALRAAEGYIHCQGKDTETPLFQHRFSDHLLDVFETFVCQYLIPTDRYRRIIFLHKVRGFQLLKVLADPIGPLICIVVFQFVGDSSRFWFCFVQLTLSGLKQTFQEMLSG